MSAHALLAAHNLAVVDAFFAGIRAVLSRSDAARSADGGAMDADGAGVVDVDGADGVDGGLGLFEAEVKAFEEAYDPRMSVLVEAEACWRAVDVARGKGRLGREKGDVDEGVVAGEGVVEA